MTSSNYKDFLNKVISKVKSKEAHGMIEKEVTNHIQTLSQSFQKGELSKEQAEEKAIKEMGNPYTLGENLNRIHKPRIDWFLVGLFIIIAAISFLPIMNGDPISEIPASYFISRQVLGCMLAIIIISGLLFFDYRKLKNLWMFFYVIGLLLFLYTGFFGTTANGAKNWIWFFGFSIDVSMITLCLFFLAWAGIFSKINEFASWTKQVFLLFLFWIPIIFYVVMPNVSVTIIYLFCISMMFMFSHVRKKLAIQLVTVNIVVSMFFLSIFFSTYIRMEDLFSRFTAFINPSAEHDSGYLYLKLRDTFSQAGWFGKGFDEIPTIPSTHTDFAFAFLVYTLGWSFGIILCIILLTFISRISLNAFRTKDLYGRLLVIGGATLFALPTFWNILMGLGIAPITGMALPFIGYGNTILIVYCAILGFILSVYRRKDIIERTIPMK